MPQMKTGRSVIVRTHGGLGNQIFQLLYARLLADGREPAVVHDANYPHAFQLSDAFAGSRRPGSVARAISAIRLPKLLERARLSDKGTVKVLGTTFADGYFQYTHFYDTIDPSRFTAEIQRLRNELGIDPKDIRGPELHHLRLGDFFASEQAQRDYLAERLEILPEGASIITNREDIVGQAIATPAIAPRRLSIVPSATASADETLRLMSRYEVIVSNDSTLAFWAACLAERRLVTPSPLLNALFSRFTTLAPTPRF